MALSTSMDDDNDERRDIVTTYHTKHQPDSMCNTSALGSLGEHVRPRCLKVPLSLQSTHHVRGR